MLSMIPGSDRFLHPLRQQQGGNAMAMPSEPATMPSQMQTRPAPDLSHVGSGGRGDVHLVSHNTFTGITSPEKIARNYRAPKSHNRAQPMPFKSTNGITP